jgi:hypothetical protein
MALMLSAALVQAADDEKQSDKKPVDPSGTWRWEHDEGGESIKNVLKLNFDGKKVSGAYQGRRGPFEIRNGKVEGDQLSFELTLEIEDRKFLIQFNGKLKGDEVAGNVEIESDGESQEYDWAAKRSLEASDVVGAWNLEIETPDGNTFTPKLTLSQDGEKKELKGEYEASNAELEFEVTNVAVKENLLSFKVSAEINGNTISGKYSVKPLGDKLSGTIEFDFNGQTGEMKVTGKRQKAKKKE